MLYERAINDASQRDVNIPDCFVFATAYHQCMLLFLYADFNIDECFCHECWNFIGGHQRLCLVNYTTRPVDFKYFFILLSYSILDVSLSFNTMNLLSIRIFDVRSNVFKVSL